MKKNEKRMILILVIITVIVGIIWVVSRNNNKAQKEDQNLNLETSGIDVNDPAYEGKKIYEKDGDIIIENPDGGVTIESKKGEETDLKEVSADEKAKYELTDVKVNIVGNRTTVTGKVKNNTSSAHKVAIGAKFYSSENRVKGSTNAVIENLKSGETQAFEMVLMGNMTGYTYKVEVEFTN